MDLNTVLIFFLMGRFVICVFAFGIVRVYVYGI